MNNDLTMAVTGSFVHELLRELQSNIYHSYADNYDLAALDAPESSLAKRTRDRLNGFFLKRGLLPREDVSTLFEALKPFAWFFHRFEDLYAALADVESKYLLVQIIAYRVLGHRKVRLPLNNEHFWKQREVLNGLMKPGETLDAGKYRLRLFDLTHIGYPISLYAPPLGPQTAFLLKQYEYRSGAVHIKAAKGDTVIDGGSCWGDTALYFAHEVGESGKVYAFELINSNLTVLKKNLNLNALLERRVEIVNRPLWSKSDVPLYFKDRGPSSRGAVNGGGDDGKSEKHFTTTIDDVVHHDRLKEVDFIKIDIEGAEVEALRGAEKTIRKCRPKLAISVYHSVSDFVDVFEFISSLGLGYKFYLGHYTIHWHETVLFAVSDGSGANEVTKTR